GPILLVGLCSPLIMRIVRLAKAQNITSIADFIAARYGKAQTVAATVALIAIIGTIPYIALELNAASSSLTTILVHIGPASGAIQRLLGGSALYVAVALAIFAAVLLTRRVVGGDRNRVDRQARCVRRCRHIRHVLDVRRAALTLCPSHGAAGHCGCAHPRSGTRHAARNDAAVAVRHRTVAASVPRHRGREQQR